MIYSTVKESENKNLENYQSPLKVLFFLLMSDVLIFLGLLYESFTDSVDFYIYYSLLVVGIAGGGFSAYMKVTQGSGRSFLVRLFAGFSLSLLLIGFIQFLIIGLGKSFAFSLSLLATPQVIFIFVISTIGSWFAFSDNIDKRDEIEKTSILVFLMFASLLGFAIDSNIHIWVSAFVFLFLGIPVYIKVLFWYWYTLKKYSRSKPDSGSYLVLNHQMKFVLLAYLVPATAVVLGLGFISTFYTN